MNLTQDKPSEKKKRKTKATLRKEFFAYAFRNFTKEVSYHLTINGYDKQASFVNSGGLLKMKELSSMFEGDFIDVQFMIFVEKLSDSIFKKVGSVSSPVLYNNLRSELLYYASMIDAEERTNLQNKERSMDAREILNLNDEDDEDTSENKEEILGVNVEEILSKDINTSFVFLVSCFFDTSYKKYYLS